MGKMNRHRRGYTLVELIIASTLGFSAVLVMLSLESSVLRASAREFVARKLSSDMMYSLHLVRRDLQATSVISEPASDGVPTNRLLAYINVNPGDLSSRIVQAEEQQYVLYCFDSTLGNLYKYSGAYPPGLSFTPFTCGCAPTNTQNRDLLVSGLENAAVSFSFVRMAHNPNAVNILFRAAARGQEVSGYTAVNHQNSL